MVSSFNGVESAIFLKTQDRFIYTFEFDVMIPEELHDQNSGKLGTLVFVNPPFSSRF